MLLNIFTLRTHFFSTGDDLVHLPEAPAERIHMPLFRKKPVVIEAIQWFKMGDHPRVLPLHPANPGFEGYGRIETLEGEHVVTPGDWIIQGVAGEFYPCKSDIFEATYERVDDDERTDSVSEVRGDEAP